MFHGGSTHKLWSAHDVKPEDFQGDGAQLGFFGAVNHIRIILALPENRRMLRIVPAGIVGCLISILILALHFHQWRSGTGGVVLQVGGYGHDLQLVDLLEFLLLCHGSSSHARQFFVHAEIILDGDCRVGYIFRFHPDAFLCFHSLVQSFRPAASRHQPARKFIHNDHPARLHNIILVAAEEVLRPKCLLQIPPDTRLFRIDVIRAVRIAQWHL